MKLILLIISVCFCLTGCSNKENSNNYTVSRTSQNISTQDNNVNNEMKGKKVEEDLSSFSTKIYTPNDSARQNNITITCQTLNGTIVKPGETFSFCNTVRKSNS